MDDYADKFERLLHFCKLGETLDSSRFFKDLRLSILKNMKDCKDMHEAYWEVIRDELLIKHYRP